MRLNDKQLYSYRNKINQLTHAQCILHENGIFEIHNIPEAEAHRIENTLRKESFITDVKAIESKKYNFNKIGFEKGFAEPEKYFTVRGILKENALEEAIEIHDTLNPKIWTEEKELIPEVRAKILQIVDKFKSQLAVDGLELKIEDIYILGSNANYNYNEDSDLDVHIIADESFDCSEKHLEMIYNCYKALFNNKYNITIKGINVELYVENKDNLSNVSAGVYSLKDGWIKNPAEYQIPEINQLNIDKGVQLWEDRYYAIVQNPTIKKIDEYFDEIYDLRKESIKNEGEFGEGNLVFKEIRRLGYLTDLKELKTELTSQELSLESLDEDLIIIEPEKSKNLLFKLKDEIEKAEGDLKYFLCKLMDIYLFQVFFGGMPRSSDEKSNLKPEEDEMIHADLSKQEWDELSNWRKSIKIETPLSECLLNEGCWGMPYTLEGANKLKNLMAKPLDAFEVGDHPTNRNDELGIGDDTLFDNISKFRKEKGYGSKASHDVRKVIQDFIKDEVLPDWDGYSYSQPEGDYEGHTWENGVKEVFQEIAEMDLSDKADEIRKNAEEHEAEDFPPEEVEDEINEAKEKLTYHYYGPVYRFGKFYADEFEDWTEAVSEAKALNNLTSKAKEYYGFLQSANLTLNPKFLEIVDTDVRNPLEGARHICPTCGRWLNDSEQCPLCDLGDESVLED